ncbi:MAG: shikimate dehydrogenase [Candidatus Altiarchaeota archaeon]
MTDFGLIGHPVAHSMSKVMHEAAFRELGLEYTYSLFDVTEGELGLFIENADFRGLNVTVPLKVAAAKHMRELSNDAAVIGAVNTIEFADGRIGHNTDGIGFIRALEEADVGVDDATFLVLGAGGAGRSIVFKLAMEKARVYVHNRDAKKALELSKDVMTRLSVRVEPVDDIASVMKDVDVLVNATSVGMEPKVDETPVRKKFLHPAITVVDIVYNPQNTRLLLQAKHLGCKTVDGTGMLVHQGAEALRIWLDVEPPIEARREAVLEELKKPKQPSPEKEPKKRPLGPG